MNFLVIFIEVNTITKVAIGIIQSREGSFKAGVCPRSRCPNIERKIRQAFFGEPFGEYRCKALEIIPNEGNHFYLAHVRRTAEFSYLFGYRGYDVGAELTKIFQRTRYNGIERPDNNELDCHGQTAAHRIEFLPLVKVHYFLLNLLLGYIVVTSGVFLSDRHFFRTQLRLHDLILLLFYAQRKKKQFDQYGKYEQRDGIVMRKAVTKTNDIAEGDTDKIKNR